MFGSTRKPFAAPEASRDTLTEVKAVMTCGCGCIPRPAENELPRWQRASTFATRKAEASTRPSQGKRLVSLGKSMQPLIGRDGKDNYVEMELFYDLDRPSDYYVMGPGDTEPWPTVVNESRDEVTPLGTIPKDTRPAGAYDSGATSPQETVWVPSRQE